MPAPLRIGDVSGAAADPPPARPPQNIAEAAKQFEALMIAQLLKSARGDQNGWMGSGEDSGDAMASGLAEEQFAQALAQSGGLGLSKQFVSSLSGRGQ